MSESKEWDIEDVKKNIDEAKREREKGRHYILGLKKIAYYYGITPQLGILQEECAELIQAISKHLRGGPIDNMLEEIADVEIMIDQIKSLLTGNDLQAINHIKENKIDRQLARIEAREREEAINNAELREYSDDLSVDDRKSERMKLNNTKQ